MSQALNASDSEFVPIVLALEDALLRRGLLLATAESCTAGWIAKVLTDRAGSSRWYEGGFVTYSNAMKHRQLGVREASLRDYGAVSEAVAQEMASGAVQASRANIALSVTGIAGPGGGSIEKPVGLVYHALFIDAPHLDIRQCWTQRWLFPGAREAVRRATVQASLAHLLERLEQLAEPA